jgi:putative N-acetyltransferase (TIGR04045 family)|tara:strand:- start:2672 stop:3115 length:444 start_codon:yes stop_codon:yes gene_type:complete
MVLTDVDRWDDDCDTIHVVAAHGSEIAGTVRVYPLDDYGRWKGDRLAVLPAHRASLVGMRLVRFAVATAAAAGGLVMEASVQLPNVTFFERLGWRCDGEPTSYYGLPHQSMTITLDNVDPVVAVVDSVAVLRLAVGDLSRNPLLVNS